MDTFMEDNYRGLIESGAYTVNELKAIAEERGDAELFRFLDDSGHTFAPPAPEAKVDPVTVETKVIKPK